MNIAIAHLVSESERTGLTPQLGLALAARGHSVLLIDATPAGGLEDCLPLSERGTVLDRRGSLILRDSTQPKLRVLTGVGRTLADGSVDSGSIEQLCKETEFALVDTDCEPDLMERALRLADRVIVPLGEDRRTYDALPAVLRLFHEVKSRRPEFDLGGFVRCESRGSTTLDEARATAARIAEEFPDLFFETTLSVTETADARAAAMLDPSDAALRIADELAKRSGVKAAPRARGWWSKLFGRN